MLPTPSTAVNRPHRSALPLRVREPLPDADNPTDDYIAPTPEERACSGFSARCRAPDLPGGHSPAASGNTRMCPLRKFGCVKCETAAGDGSRRLAKDRTSMWT